MTPASVASFFKEECRPGFCVACDSPIPKSRRTCGDPECVRFYEWLYRYATKAANRKSAAWRETA